jgi:hypothetical protein
MSTTDKLTIAYGRQTFPDDVQAVWGARLIWPNDLLHDRQDLSAHNDDAKHALIEWLNGEDPGTGAISRMRHALESPYSLGLTPEMEFHDEAVIYEDERGKIVGSAQGSYGYLYVAGWLKDA